MKKILTVVLVYVGMSGYFLRSISTVLQTVTVAQQIPHQTPNTSPDNVVLGINLKKKKIKKLNYTYFVLTYRYL